MTEVTEAAPVESTDEHAVPRLIEGVSLCGEYEGGGYQEPRYLVSRGDGQMILVSEMLYRVAESIDGERTLAEIAEDVRQNTGADVSAPGVEYLVNEKLHPMAIATLSEPVQDPPRSKPLLSLAMHGVLMPAKLVRRLAAVLAPLHSPVAVALALCGLVTADAWIVASGHLDQAIQHSVGDPAQVLAVIGLMQVMLIFHELGHASGCRYSGAQPGAIGVGMLLVVPAFYTNVTDAYRLNRKGRLRTDLGGVYFTVIFIPVATMLYGLTGYPPFLVCVALSHLNALQQLLPLLRLDGYYILGDLVGVPNLFAYVRPYLNRLMGKHTLQGRSHVHLRPKVRLIVTVWVATVVPVLVLALGSLLFRMPLYMSNAFTQGGKYWAYVVHGVGHGSPGLAALGLVSMIILLLPWLGAAAFLTRISQRISRKVAAKRRTRLPRGRHRQARAPRRRPRVTAS
ncbi:hypothetical protein [Saccharopolyspora rosea]|uniref:Peptide zinc metalloprotease protein n=1 Tax=Saccharopolyspora rosea TaxID=524884 RepID=A0ABW3FUC3_9PSEU|nr:hypothetical protein [Saccharopolyspora rosea]